MPCSWALPITRTEPQIRLLWPQTRLALAPSGSRRHNPQPGDLAGCRRELQNLLARGFMKPAKPRAPTTPARPVPAASRPLDFGVSSPSLPPSFQQHSGLPSPAFLQKTVGNPCQMPRMGPGVNAPGGRGHGDPFPLKPLSKLSQPLFLLRAGSQRGKLQLLRDLSEKVATCQEAAARPLLPQRQLRAGFLVGPGLFSPPSPANPICTAREGWHSK